MMKKREKQYALNDISESADMKRERAEFERFAISQGWRIELTKPNRLYVDRRSNSGWGAWVARAQRSGWHYEPSS